MENLLNIEPWWRFAAALLIGALIGLEREFIYQRTGDADFAGIRTFSLMALLGALAAFLSETYGIILFLVVFAGLALLVWGSYLGDIYRGHREGITTEVVGLTVPLLGAMVVWGQAELAAALSVITALILALKPALHGMARRMSSADLRATLEFALISAVILPILPNRAFGPYDVLNPFQIWLLVVLVSGIGFVGYGSIKILGAEQGIGLTGLLGGLVSSTATTVSFAGRSKASPGLSSLLVRGILIASTVMLVRIMALVAVVYPPVLSLVSIPLGVMLAVSLALVLILWLRDRGSASELREEVTVSNPLRISTAISFAIAFTIVLVGVRAANEFFGDAGVYAASAITGLIDVDAITLSATELASFGQIARQVAGLAILLAALVNTAAKGVMAMTLGSLELRKRIGIVFGIVLLAGILSTVFTMMAV